MEKYVLKRSISITIFSTPAVFLSHAVFPAMIASQYTEIMLLKLGHFISPCMFSVPIGNHDSVHLLKSCFLVAVYDFQGGRFFYVHLCIRYAFCNTFLYTKKGLYALLLQSITLLLVISSVKRRKRTTD
jgi:hypothetical protein